MRKLVTAVALVCAALFLAFPIEAKADSWMDSWQPPAWKAAQASKAKTAGKATRQAAFSNEDRPQRRDRTASKPSLPRASIVSTPAATGGGASGIASYYWQPQRVASGGWFNPNAMTAAHKTLPFGTRVRVTHVGNGRSVDVTINDRGPYIAGRVIDLSKAAAGVIGMQGQGVAPVRVQVLGR